MKLRSRHISKPTRTDKIVRVTVIAVALLCVGLVLPNMFFLGGRIVMAPVHATNDWFRTSTARLPMFLRERTELINKINELEQKVAVAEGTDLTEQRLYEENVWLKQLLGVVPDSRIAAAVIARPGELAYDYLQIDKGSDDGILAGAPVYSGRDNVIGVVAHTAPSYAFVELFTTPGFSTTAFISGANVMATIDGHGGGIARVRVPQGVPLAVGNLVHMPSIEPGVFGRIAYLENEPSQPEQFGYIALTTPISSIHYVAVGKTVLGRVESPVIEERIRNIIKEATTINTATLNLASTTIIASSTSSSTTP